MPFVLSGHRIECWMGGIQGGVNFQSTEKEPLLDKETVERILSEYKIHNADVHIRGDYDDEDLIDVIEGNRIYIPAVYVLNKIDALTLEELQLLGEMPNYCPVSR
jgi:ribosome-interacting GTPase 1